MGKSMSIMRMTRVWNELGTTRTPGYNAIRDGLLTTPVKVGPRAAGIPSHEVEAILTARIGGATDEQIRALVQRLHAQRVTAAAKILAGV